MDLSNEIVIHKRKGNIEYIQFKRLLEYKNLIHCFTMKSSGELNFRLENETLLKQSYNKISEIVGFKNIVNMKQAHTDIVEIVENKDQKFIWIDGIITKEKEIALSSLSADCTSLMFFDPVKNVIANVHSGWRGTLQGIAKNAVMKMKEKYNVNPKDIICAIGPSIRACHFEVDEDVMKLFLDKYNKMNNIDRIIKKDEVKNKYYIDTVQIIKNMLIDVGVKEENILDSNICNVCNSNLFYSYRVEGQEAGRNTAIIQLI